MTAGVQNLEPAAYLPPPPSKSPSDAKATGAADRQNSDTQNSNAQGEPQNFQSELQRQDTGSQATKPAGRPDTGSARSVYGKPVSSKPGSSKTGKKRDAAADDPSRSSALTPAQVAEPQKQVLPLVLALAQPDEPAKADEPARPDDHATLSPNQTPAGGVPTVSPDSSNHPVLPVAADVPLPEEAAKPEDQSKTSASNGASTESQPVSRAEVKLPATHPEPVTAAIRETVDSASSSPSALAFAARISAAPQKAGESAPKDPSQPSAASGSPTPARIPVRYAATAQILQNADAVLKPDPSAAVDRSARTDVVLPRIETAREAAPNPGPSAPQQAMPTARLERIIEPPAAPPASPHDIRVRVPDTNGGSMQVRFLESGGEVRVSVRTADEALAQNLRSHLNDLSQRLADGGIPAEIWKPGSSTASSQNNQQHPDRDGRGSSGQQSGGQSGQQDRQEKRPAWLEEMEASLHGAQE